MQKGEIKERGRHIDLIALNGVYKKLVSRQLVEGGEKITDQDLI
jgi:ABC-type multidrug transport system fused ATPase/permease subunit